MTIINKKIENKLSVGGNVFEKYCGVRIIMYVRYITSASKLRSCAVSQTKQTTIMH